MKSWRSTVSAIVTATAAFVLMFPTDFTSLPIIVHFAQFVALGGLVSLGISSKDAAVHSTVGEVQTATTLQQAADIKAANK